MTVALAEVRGEVKYFTQLVETVSGHEEEFQLRPSIRRDDSAHLVGAGHSSTEVDVAESGPAASERFAGNGDGLLPRKIVCG